MLPPVDGDGSLFGDAGADAIGTLGCLGPHGAEPNSPMPVLVRIRIVSSVLDRDTGAVTEEQRVSGLANQVVEAIDLFLCARDELLKWLTKLFELVRSQNTWRLCTDGIDAVLVDASLPGG